MAVDELKFKIGDIIWVKGQMLRHIQRKVIDIDTKTKRYVTRCIDHEGYLWKDIDYVDFEFQDNMEIVPVEKRVINDDIRQIGDIVSYYDRFFYKTTIYRIVDITDKHKIYHLEPINFVTKRTIEKVDSGDIHRYSKRDPKLTLSYFVCCGDYAKVLVRNKDTDEWKLDMFSHISEKTKRKGGGKFVCVGGVYKQCIPYESNHDLKGLTRKCDEYYVNW